MFTDDEINEFFDRGFVVRRALFTPAEIATMRRAFDALEAIADGLASTGEANGAWFVLGESRRQTVIKRVVWAGAAQPCLLEIAEDRRLTLPAAQLLGSREMDQLLCQAHFKRPGDGVVFGWHQDIQHRDKGDGTWRDVNGRGSFVQTLIAIDAMTEDSGPLQFIPGSARWGAVDFGSGDYDDPASADRLPPAFRGEDAVTVTADPGDTLFFGPYTAHASFENRSRAYRRVLINGYAYPGANSRIYPGRGSCRRLTVEEFTQRVPTPTGGPVV